MGILTERLIFVVNAQGITQTTGQVSQLQGAFGGLSKATGLSKGNLAALAGTGVVGFLGSSAQAASNLSEQVSASSVIFGKGAEDVQRFAKGAADSIGLSERAALEAANSYASLFKNAGAADQDAARFSVTLTKLAADIASLRNASQEDVSMALRSGLTGEVEPLRRLGVILNDNAVRARAVQMGLATVASEVDDGAKVFARLNLILEQTKDAQGDYARTSDSLANSQRTAKAQLEDFQATIGQALTPALAEATGNLSELLSAVNAVLGPMGGLATVIKVGMSVVNPFGAAVSHVTGLFKSHKDGAEKAAEAQAKYAADTEASARVQRDQAAASEQQTKALKVFTDAQEKAASAVERAEKSSRSVDRARRDEADAEKTLNELLVDGLYNRERVARADDALSDSIKSTVDAEKQAVEVNRQRLDLEERIAEARKNLAEIEKGSSKRDVREAELAVAEATRDRQRSTLDLVEAEKKARGGTTIGIVADEQKTLTAEERQRAELDLATAQDRVELSTFNVQKAEERLQELRNAGKPGTQEYEDAVARIRDLEDERTQVLERVRDAAQKVADAQALQAVRAVELAEAEKDDPERAEKIADARRKVADAHYNTAEAKRDEVTATAELDQAEAEASNQRRIRQERDAEILAWYQANANFETGRGGLGGPGTGTGFNPLAVGAGLSSMLSGVQAGMGGSGVGESWQRALAGTGSATFVNVYTASDPNATVRAVEQWASRNGGSPRR